MRISPGLPTLEFINILQRAQWLTLIKILAER